MMKKFQLMAFAALLLLASCEKEKQECEQGYTGPNCNEQVTPDAIKISGVNVTSMPAYDGDYDWDIWSSGPDIYIEVLINEKVVYTSNYIEDVNVYEDYYFRMQPTITASAESTVSVKLWDYDSSNSDDFMGGIYGDIYNNENGFPEKIYMDVGENITFNLDVYYVWN